jgi:hypothetical protein
MKCFYEVSQSVYNGLGHSAEYFFSSPNPDYWKDLHEKFAAIHSEIQDASKSLNKSFGTTAYRPVVIYSTGMLIR